jgi:hypothetical protein
MKILKTLAVAAALAAAVTPAKAAADLHVGDVFRLNRQWTACSTTEEVFFGATSQNCFKLKAGSELEVQLTRLVAKTNPMFCVRRPGSNDVCSWTMLPDYAIGAQEPEAVTPAKAGDVPVQFQGDWFTGFPKPRRIGPRSIQFGDVSCDIVKAEPDSVLPRTTISVAWTCPNSYPDAKPVESVWILKKVAGREVLMNISPERPVNSTIWERY